MNKSWTMILIKIAQEKVLMRTRLPRGLNLNSEICKKLLSIAAYAGLLILKLTPDQVKNMSFFSLKHTILL